MQFNRQMTEAVLNLLPSKVILSDDSYKHSKLTLTEVVSDECVITK